MKITTTYDLNYIKSTAYLQVLKTKQTEISILLIIFMTQITSHYIQFFLENTKLQK